MVVQSKVRGFICTTAHPEGLKRAVKEEIDYVKKSGKIEAGKNVLVVGASMGYGLSARIAAAFGGGAATLGIIFDRAASGLRTASAGWYNTAAFELYAAQEGLYAKTINADAFSIETKTEAAEIIERDMGKVDLIIYSVASPKRTMQSGEVFSSVLKPTGKPYTNKTIDLRTKQVSEITIQPASDSETVATVKVMGGEDWIDWVRFLKERNLLADGAVTVAFSYIGPELTHAVYKDGTIGMAKRDLYAAAEKMRAEKLCRAVVSVNKALVTQSSSAIPVVPLYISLLYKVMKQKGTHEGCVQQMCRLFKEKRLMSGAVTDCDGLIRLDDWELDAEVQSAVAGRWESVTDGTVQDIADLKGYDDDFMRLFGFGLDGVDYSADVGVDIKIPSVD